VESSNPYRPGFALAPATLAGRDEVIEDLVDALETAALDRRTPRPVLLLGARGMGKTVLLGELAARAGREYGWPTVHVEAQPRGGLLEQLAEQLDACRALIEDAPRGRSFQAESAVLKAQLAGVGGEVRFARRTDRGEEPVRLDRSLAALASIAVERDTGVVLTLDETQLAERAELAAVGAVLQRATSSNWPVVVALAGLPTMRNRTPTYFERAVWHTLGLVSSADAEVALTEPARDAGRPMQASAARTLAVASGGYPYAVQLYGHHAWRASSGERTISVRAAERALPRAQRELERGLYANRWTAAAPSQQQYMTAVAALQEEGELPTGRAVADRLGRTTKQVSRIRDELLTQGTLTVEDSVLRFAVPGMSAYVLRASDASEARRLGGSGQPPAQLAIRPMATPAPPRPRRSASTRDRSRKPKR
jgi:hypothetical protein